MTPTPCYTAADDLGQVAQGSSCRPSTRASNPHPSYCAALTNLFPHLVGWGCEGGKGARGGYNGSDAHISIKLQSQSACPARRAPVLCYTPCSSPSKGMVGSGARSQIRRALLHACMHVHVSCLSWRAHWARAGPGYPPQRKALHVMTCMTHYHWASTRALDMRATVSLGRAREGRGGAGGW